MGRPAPFDGALVDPKTGRFERMRRTVRAEQLAILAISSSLSASPCDLLLIIFRIRSWVEGARFGAMATMEGMLSRVERAVVTIVSETQCDLGVGNSCLAA